MTVIKDVENLLKSGWYSNFQLQMTVQSSGADRAARKLRECPPEGYIFVQRPKEIVVEGQRRCLEYTLQRIDEKEEINGVS